MTSSPSQQKEVAMHRKGLLKSILCLIIIVYALPALEASAGPKRKRVRAGSPIANTLRTGGNESRQKLSSSASARRADRTKKEQLRQARVLMFAKKSKASTKTARKRSKPASATTGKASWYGERLHGKKTASGKKYNKNAMTAAHRKLPLGTQVQVKNLENGRTVIVKINDRGPYVEGRIIDLSEKAWEKIGGGKRGEIRVAILQ